jgi:hypothetical protein
MQTRIGDGSLFLEQNGKVMDLPVRCASRRQIQVIWQSTYNKLRFTFSWVSRNSYLCPNDA